MFFFCTFYFEIPINSETCSLLMIKMKRRTLNLRKTLECVESKMKSIDFLAFHWKTTINFQKPNITHILKLFFLIFTKSFKYLSSYVFARVSSSNVSLYLHVQWWSVKFTVTICVVRSFEFVYSVHSALCDVLSRFNVSMSMETAKVQFDSFLIVSIVQHLFATKYARFFLKKSNWF